MTNEFEKQLDITDEVEALSDEKKMECMERALINLGIDPEGEFEETPELTREFAEQLKVAAVEVIVGKLQSEGLIEMKGVDENGEITFGLTEDGQRYCQSEFGDIEE